jgi:hypothetical protein
MTDEAKKPFSELPRHMQLWLLFREDCPPLYVPIIDAIVRLPIGVDFVPNCYGAIRQSVPTATDAQIDAAGHWWNRLALGENIPMANADPRIQELRHWAHVTFTVLAEKKDDRDPINFIRLVLHKKFPDMTDKEFNAATEWLMEMNSLTPEDLEAVTSFVGWSERDDGP